ncbi:MAG: hypothetical protein EPN91_10765 [Salinibacterium sp.]|nr:MAG: hypothetical protein EPN91_10765 [Salinibacterium sp.]
MTAAELDAIQACLRYVRNKRDATFSSTDDMRAAFAALPVAEHAVAAARAFPDRLDATFDAAGENPPGFIARSSPLSGVSAPLSGVFSVVAAPSGVLHHALTVLDAVPGVRKATLRTLCGEGVPDGVTAGEITCVPCLRVFFKNHKAEHLSSELRAKLYPGDGLQCPKCAGLLIWTVWPEYVQPCPHGCGQQLPPCKVPGCTDAGCIGFTPGKRVCENHRSMLVETP